jgi:Glu-tRNA(Gln) amidotransferase subunit E-like FAD-binding protein
LREKEYLLRGRGTWGLQENGELILLREKEGYMFLPETDLPPYSMSKSLIEKSKRRARYFRKLDSRLMSFLKDRTLANNVLTDKRIFDLLETGENLDVIAYMIAIYPHLEFSKMKEIALEIKGLSNFKSRIREYLYIGKVNKVRSDFSLEEIMQKINTEGLNQAYENFCSSGRGKGFLIGKLSRMGFDPKTLGIMLDNLAKK